MLQTTIKITTILLALFFAAPLYACPFCHTETGQAVNRQIFGAGFALNVLIAALPFLIVYLFVAGFHFGIPSCRKRFEGN